MEYPEYPLHIQYPEFAVVATNATGAPPKGGPFPILILLGVWVFRGDDGRPYTPPLSYLDLSYERVVHGDMRAC